MAFIYLLCLIALISCAKVSPANGQSSPAQSKSSDLKTYIVHLTIPDGHHLSELKDLESWYYSFLPASSTASENQSRVLYSYRNVMTGFAARLTPDEVAAMQDKPGFVAAHPEQIYRLQTTHSPQFLGLPLPQGSSNGSTMGKGIIIGVMDTGVTPDHPSFSGDGMPPPPAKWKGRCDFESSRCNNKLIGARTFDASAKKSVSMPPIDDVGHGTHTASTAAGASVQRANTLGMADGTAGGMAPHAHLAMYKVCFGIYCSLGDILAGLDAALADDVDIISMSLGGSSSPFYTDGIAVAAFAAIQRGIFVSCSAGNSGPNPGSLSNVAPWILTVGASTIDRNIVSIVKLGNGAEYEGETLYQPSFTSTLLPLVYPGIDGTEESIYCVPGYLKSSQVKGKVVLCERGMVSRFSKAEEVQRAGGAAMIMMNQEMDGFSTLADAYDLPASHVSYFAGKKIKAYINVTKTPTAAILFKGTVLGNPTAPALTSFSSRGPSLVSPGILKPDIIGPGVNILAAWPFPIRNDTKAKYYFDIISGTSMSCPHLSGIVALIKGVHPDWSPAAIKSAIMTSAKQLNIKQNPILDEQLQPADVFAIGAGHVDAVKAIDPGFVYDIQPDDYIPYLCGLGYTDKQVGTIAHKTVKCSGVSSIPEGELNYPSFSVTLGPPQTFTRTVTNVGTDYSTFAVTVVPPPGVHVTVKPDKLNFSKLEQKATYSITLSRANSTHKATKFTEGYLRWDSKKYSVRSPISVKFN
ncbi:subtilisin-like protease 4 [Rhodamnia argentea]|uniref:Subtilisin-like protease 4 n=1 Tax=Rhodamnia argentea TaxID=178133 RepID=A0A8B8MWF5_9MYRT|nr:subtilisin-like protease 4 [Rhodamnia argentea]